VTDKRQATHSHSAQSEPFVEPTSAKHDCTLSSHQVKRELLTKRQKLLLRDSITYGEKMHDPST
jgi:hypothetical protein